MRNRLLLSVALLVAQGGEAAGYVPLQAVEPPKVIACAEPFDANWKAENLLGNGHAEYASKGKALETFVDFDLGAALPIAAFRHQQRNNALDLVAEAELLFSGTPDFAAPVRVPVRHVDEGGAVTVATFEPVSARYVRWRVTKMERGTSPNLGGKGVAFFSAGAAEARPGKLAISVSAPQIFKREGGRLVQQLEVTVESPYHGEFAAAASIGEGAAQEVAVRFGRQTVSFPVEGKDAPREVPFTLSSEAEGTLVEQRIRIPAMLKRTIYVLPHSHTDIGYTDLQPAIEAKQVENLRKGIAAAARTADYPEGCRFVWNVEVGWAADLYLQRATPEEREAFFGAVRAGRVALEGMYLNVLTGLCRPEELLRLFRFAKVMEEQTGVAIDTAMISDVPGYAWGTVTAMAQAGIRYFSVAPNFFDRIGTTLVEWENRPFWWVGPDGRSKVLVWIPYKGYATSHVWKRMSAGRIRELCAELEKRAYPYDIAYLRWSGIEGDNAEPDAAICDDLRAWNEEYAYPQFVISSTHEAFAAFDAKYGDAIPSFSGDWSPYWEDGAGSSAAETAMNRHTSTRLRQAEALFAMRAQPAAYPAKDFEDAWRNTLLYSEHTWGAHCSVSQPDSDFTKAQWHYKQAYALEADKASRTLLVAAAGDGDAVENAVDVYNTSSSVRSEVVYIPAALSKAGDRVMARERRKIADKWMEFDEAVASQRLSNGDLAVRVSLFAFSGKRLSFGDGPAYWPEDNEFIKDEKVKVTPPNPEQGQGWSIQLDNAVYDRNNKREIVPIVRVEVDEKTGCVSRLRFWGDDVEAVDFKNGHLLNEYLYFTGSDTSKVQRASVKKISIKESGPLVASLLAELDAPGCNSLTQEIRVTAGRNRAVELINRMDKARLPQGNNYYESKESVSFAFPFNVPDGEIRMDTAFGTFDARTQQLPGACKNWLTAGSWVAVGSNKKPEEKACPGVALVSLDAPLMQVGGLTANLLNSQGDPATWRKTIEPTGAVYPWVMNNHWGTNYRAYQDGFAEFRFVLRPYWNVWVGEADIQARAMEDMEPFTATPARGEPPKSDPFVRICDPRNMFADRDVEPHYSNSQYIKTTGFKPSDDGKAYILRLFNIVDQHYAGWHGEESKLMEAQEAKLIWRTPHRVFISGVDEKRGQEVTGETLRLRKFELLTLRVEPGL